MKRAVIVLIVLAVIAGALGGGWWFINENPAWWFWAQDEFDKTLVGLGLAPAEAPPGLVASGFIEAEEASVTTELGGRIVALYADEGDEVEQGVVLVQLDDSLLLGRIELARADLAVAEAQLAQVQAGVRPETLAVAKAQLQQAIAGREAARVAWEDAQALRDNPQDLELAIIAARAQWNVLGFQQQQAQALANSAQAGRDFADETVRILETFEPYQDWVRIGVFSAGQAPPEIPLPPDLLDGVYYIGDYKIVIDGGQITVYYQATIKIPPAMLSEARYQQALATYQSWTAWTGVVQAAVARGGVESYLAELARQQASPLTLEAQVNAAQSQFEVAAASVALALARVEGLQMGATPEQIAAVEAQVAMARAALQALEVQAAKFALRAPIAGLVLARPVHVGEVALPGAPQMTLGNLDELTLTVYVPQDRLGQVSLGQVVSVTVDAYPGRVFPGTVTFIANRAEFTPKNVQTREERVNMVFAVKVSLPNPDHALKPGMPADAVVVDG